jgi:hypothetical protein
MANSVDPKSLVGAVTPSVYVGKIVLKESTVLTSRNRRTESVPNDVAGTECILDLSMKEVVGGASSGWASNKELYNKYRIKIIRSLDASVTEALAGVPQNRILDAIESPRIKEHLFVEEISLADKTTNQLKNKSKLSLAGDGQSVREYILQYSDGSLPKIINHLTYFIVAYCDTKNDNFGLIHRIPPSLVGDVDVEGVIRNGSVVRTGTLYMVKEDPRVVWAGPMHMMPDGAIHTGATHSKTSRALLSAAVNNTKIQDERALKTLQKFTFDLSIADQSKFSTPKGGPKLLFNNPTSTTVVNRNASFTDLYLNIDRDNVVQFFFGIDYNNLLAKNTELGRAHSNLSNFNFEGSSAYASLFRISEISRMTLKRRRVSPDPEFNELSSQINSDDKFDDNELDEILLSVAPSTHTAINASGLLASIEEIKVHTPHSPRLVQAHEIPGGLRGATRSWPQSRWNTTAGFRYFTGRDTSLTDKTYGSYQYALEIEITDRSREIIGNMVSILSRAKGTLDGYLQRGSSKRSYNSKINRFTDSFIAFERGMGTGLHPLAARPWYRALTDYSTVLAAASLISSDNRFTTVSDTIRTLTPFICSAGANPDSVQAVISLIDSLIAKLASLNTKGVVNSDISSLDSGFNDRTSRAKNASLKRILVENFFENQVDVNFTKGVGYDYLTTSGASNSSGGLSKISLDNYFKRAQAETLKYYKNVDANINIVVKGKNYTSGDSLSNNDLRYLSPASVKIYDQSYDLSNGLQIISDQAKIAEEGALYHTLSSDLDGETSDEPAATKYSSLLRENSIVEFYGINTLSNADVEASKPFFVEEGDCDVKAPPTSDPPYSPGVLAQSPGPQRPPPALFGLLRSFVLGSNIDKPECVDDCSNQIDLYNSLAPYNKIFTAMDTQTSLASLPNQIKSVILGNISTGVVNLDWFNTERPTEDPLLGPIYRLGIESLCEVQVLVGFKVSNDNKSLAQSPIFAPLSRGITSAAPAGTSLLCRLVPYNNSDFNLSGMSNNLKLPIYNEYFIIQVTQSGTTVLSSQSSVPLAAALSDEQGSPELVQYAYTTKRPIPYVAPSKKKRAPRRRSTKEQSSNRSTSTTARSSNNTRGSY